MACYRKPRPTNCISSEPSGRCGAPLSRTRGRERGGEGTNISDRLKGASGQGASFSVSRLPMVNPARRRFCNHHQPKVGLPMRKSKPLSAEALAELEADRLAALLLDAAEHDAALARTLRVSMARDGSIAAASIATIDMASCLAGIRSPLVQAETGHPPITYFPSLRETRLFLVSAVRALDTDFSADLFPFKPIR